MSRISQEFYCNECDGYFLVRLNMSLNHRAKIVCPNCGHEHNRGIVDGMILESGHYGGKVIEEVLTTKATYSKRPLTEKMRKNARDGVPVETDRWLEVAARERGEDYE